MAREWPQLQVFRLDRNRGKGAAVQEGMLRARGSHRAFSDADLAREGFEGAKYVCSPPLRDPSNREALWRGLQAGDLHIFGSDHCSFNYRE